MPETPIIICTRLDSSRLPCKALRNIGGKSSLDHILSRTEGLGMTRYLAVPDTQTGPFMATTMKHKDTILVQGNADSPLHRTANLLRNLGEKPKFFVRITHDDLLIDAKTLQDLLSECERQEADYGFSPGIAEGGGVEVIATDNLLKACEERKEPTEFISYFVRRGKVIALKPRESIKRPYRLTLDYPEDELLLKILLKTLGPDASLDSICAYLDTHQHLLELNRQPDITFYTCAKDAADTVQETMDSVLGLGISNMEYVLVDDGSRDSTLDLMARVAARDSRVELLVNDENLGLASSSNRAISEARGRAVVRVDADDLLNGWSFREHWPELLKRIEAGESVIYPAYSEINQYGGYEQGKVSPTLRHHAGGAVMSRAVLNEIRFKDGLKHWDGLELYRRFSQRGPVGYFDQPIWQYRRRPGSMSQDTPERQRVLEDING